MKIFTTKDVKIRYKHPGTSAQVKGVIYKGFEIEVEGVVPGESLEGNSKWYFDKHDNYYWSGGFVEQPIAELGWGLRTFQIPKLWQHTRGASAKVAVLDTGMSAHPDLGQIVQSRDFYNQDDSCPDIDGHGTHCIGIIAAGGVQRVTGVAPDCQLFVGRINKANGSLRKERLIAGLKWAAEICEADIINISAGLFDDFDDVREAVAALNPGKTMVVAAIGNDGSHHAEAGLYPAKYENCVSVGAVDVKSALISETDRFAGLTVAAPGHNIESTSLSDGYILRSGTSMASAFVSGLMALFVSYIKENALDVTLPQLKDLLVNSADTRSVDNYSYKVINPVKTFNNLR